MDAIYKGAFPSLTDVAGKKTSEADSTYNCIAWAFKESHRVWWPHSKAYWPIPVDGMTILEAFEAWFAEDGWEQTESPDVEEGFEKVALFMANGEPTHAARLLDNGLWTSKLGWNPKISIDLSHGIADLDGPLYGTVARIYRKPAVSPFPSA